MKHTWLKLLTSLLWSKKFRGLPDNDHRIVYICHLIFAKMGLENEPVSWLAATSFVTKYRYKIIVKNLVDCGLFDEYGRVNGFEDSQLTPDAYRKRRQREREKSRDSHADSHAGNPPDSRKQKADSSPAEKKKNPHTPLTEIAEVVAHLSVVTGRAFSADRATDQIAGVIRRGATVDDCRRVIDYLWAKWGDDQKMRGFVDKTTPFRKANFDRYLDEALASGAAGTGSGYERVEEPWK